MKIAVLDPKLIPDYVDVVIGDFVYGLQFAVEVESPTGEPHLIDMDSTNEGDPKEDDPKKSEPPKGVNPEENMDVDGKDADPQAPGLGYGAPPSTGHQVTKNGTELLVGDGAFTAVQGKGAQKIRPKAVLSHSGGMLGENGTWSASVLPTKHDSGTSLKKFSSASPSSVRSSKRHVGTMDLNSTEKAAKLKARKNLDSPTEEGNLKQPYSFISRDDASILYASRSLGVVLGDNDKAVFNSLKRLKDLEFSSLVESEKLRKQSSLAVEAASTVCSTEDNLDLETLNLVYSEIAEGLGDGGCDPLILQTPISQKASVQLRNKKRNKKKYSSR